MDPASAIDPADLLVSLFGVGILVCIWWRMTAQFRTEGSKLKASRTDAAAKPKARVQMLSQTDRVGLRRAGHGAKKDPNRLLGEIAKGNVALIAGALLGLSYAAIRLSYENFYAWLGGSPAEVGFQPVDALGRALLGLALVLTAVVIGGFLVALASWLVVIGILGLMKLRTKLSKRELPEPRVNINAGLNLFGLNTPGSSQTWLLPVLAVLPLMIVVLVFWQQITLGAEPSGGLWITGFILVAALPMYIATLFRTLRQWLSRKGYGKFGTVLLVAWTFVTAVLALYSYADQGRSEALYIRRNGQQPSGGISAISLFGYKGECVTINPSISDLPDLTPVIYLGRAEGAIFAFDIVLNNSIRYPVAQVVITGVDDGDCAWAAYVRNQIQIWEADGVNATEFPSRLKALHAPSGIANGVITKLNPHPSIFGHVASLISNIFEQS